MQVQRLEALLGQTLLLRGKGGAVHLTSHGRYLLDRSRDLLALNDEIWSAFRTPAVEGTVRARHAGRLRDALPARRAAPLRHLAPGGRRGRGLRPVARGRRAAEAGRLDLTLCSDGHAPRDWPATQLWRGPLLWITSDRYAPHRQDPLPLALAEDSNHCMWRSNALEVLRAAGRRYRVAYTAATLTGTYAPVMAGLAVTVSNVAALPEGLRLMRPDEGLPPLPESGIDLLKARNPRQPVTDALASYIAETFQAELRRNRQRGVILRFVVAGPSNAYMLWTTATYDPPLVRSDPT